MVIVPVRRNDAFDRLGDINPQFLQIRQTSRCSAVGSEAGVNDYPVAQARVRDDALTESGSEKGDFQFVWLRRGFWLYRGQGMRGMFRLPFWRARCLRLTKRGLVGSE